MGINKIKVVYFKELLEAVRNTKTLFLMVFMPVILFPLLFIGIGYFTGKQIAKTEKLISKIAIINNEDAPVLVGFIKKDKSVDVVEKTDAVSDLDEGLVQLVVQIPENYDEHIEDEIPVTIDLLYDQSNIKSISAHKRFINLFNDYQKDFYKNKLAQKGISNKFLDILNITSKNIASSDKMGAFVIGKLFPFLILILAYAGAMYTALSITVGEKERQTIETILASAIKRQEIVLGKFLAVFTASLITAFLGLLSLFFTFQTTLGSAALKASIQISISMFSVLTMFGLIIPVAAIFSAVLITLGSAARSNKEGEMYATMFLMVVLALGIVSVIPGFEPDLKLFLIPVMNTTLIQKELLMSDINFLHIFFTLLSTVFFALGSLYTAVKLFSRDEILFRS